MSSAALSTVHERYLGTGIVQISQLKSHHPSDPWYYISRSCRLRQNNLTELFKHVPCKPYLPENHITAQISGAQWNARASGGEVQLDDGRTYLCVRFRDDARITILNGISRLEAARSSMERGFVQRWWVVDFLSDGKTCFDIA
jgi:hypothetical protein